MTAAPYDLAPLLPILLIGGSLAAGGVVWIGLRQRDARPAARLHALTVLTMFLTFDLVLFGAFTRLSDSGLGCPDWPGCYASASPHGSAAQIEAAQQAAPGGPVNPKKAWVEMTHRYLATGVGGLIVVLAVRSWLAVRRGSLSRPPGWSADASPTGTSPTKIAPRPSPWWATATLGWVCLQGAFGAWTVTMKLYPAIVTAHLLGGVGLLALLGVQTQAYLPKPLPMSSRLRAATLAVAVLTLLQVALGGWVSSNYAVLACREFPSCQQSLWPAMDFEHGFTLRRGLGVDGGGAPLSYAALTAIHYVHRLGAYVVLGATAALAWGLRARGDAISRRWAAVLAAVAFWQGLSGLGNVLLGWPLAIALAHTAGAAVLVTLLAVLLTRSHQAMATPGTAAVRPPRTFASVDPDRSLGRPS